MLRMNHTIRGMILAAAIALPAATALADWTKEDGSKMTQPMLPDPNGWDVRFMYPMVLADDWKCSETGPVTDVHFWLSCFGDLADPANSALISKIHISIHDDIPTGPNINYSRPGRTLWQRDFNPTQFKIVPWPGGNQGWYDPSITTTSPYIENNHQKMWQVNIAEILEPFKQEQGKIYWLDLSVFSAPGTNAMFGWKSSADHFNDDAVWGIYDPTGVDNYPENVLWQELRYPPNSTYPIGQSMDLSFVITPEPGSILLIVAGSALLLNRRRR